MQPTRPPFGYEPYAPPGFEGRRPAFIRWYRLYAASVVVLYVGFFLLWQLFTSSGPNAAPQEVGWTVEGTMMVVALSMVVAFSGFFVLAALVPYKPWGWTIGLIAICLGLSSCLMVAAVPLLIFWLKPETKAAFGRL
jgi:hypothetical protein